MPAQMMDLTHIRFDGRSTAQSRDRPRQLPRERVPPAPLPPPLSVGGLPEFVLAQAGLNPAAYRPAPLERRTAACLRAIKADSERAARTQLSVHPHLRGLALSTLLIGVSEFFRDAVVFDTLQAAIIPALRARSGPLRIWSLGCSTGAELYSLAIMLAEADLLQRAYLLGTDCRADAVAGAEAGIFARDALAGLDPAIQSRYFELTRAGWRVAESLRRQTAWEAADATRELARGSWDLVLCRNVVIYLQNPVAETMFRGIVERLVPGGFLVVGKAERVPAALGLTAVGRCVYRAHVD